MKGLKTTGGILLSCMLYVLVSCSSNAAKTETSETKALDSASTSLEQSNKELEEQTKKVEESLEELDKETAKNN